jgi:hypothetical protein
VLAGPYLLVALAIALVAVGVTVVRRIHARSAD